MKVYSLIFLIFYSFTTKGESSSLIQSEHVDVYFASPTTQEYAAKVSKLAEESFKKYEKWGFRKLTDYPHILKRKKAKLMIVSSIATVAEGPHKGVVPWGLVSDDPDYGAKIELIDNIDEKN